MMIVAHIGVIAMPSIVVIINIITIVSRKFIRQDTFFDKRKMLLGTFIFERIPPLPAIENIPAFAESVK